jgi:hypothetical protein
VKPPTTAFKVILETADVSFSDWATYSQISPIKNWDQDGQSVEEIRLRLGWESCSKAGGDGGNVCVGEWGYVPVGALAEEVRHQRCQGDQHNSHLGDVKGEKVGAECRGVIRPMNKEIVQFAILQVWWTWDLDFLGGKDGLDMIFVIEQHRGEDPSVLEGGETLFECSGDIRDGRGDSRGGGLVEVCDVPCRSAVARGTYRG